MYRLSNHFSSAEFLCQIKTVDNTQIDALWHHNRCLFSGFPSKGFKNLGWNGPWPFFTRADLQLGLEPMWACQCHILHRRIGEAWGWGFVLFCVCPRAIVLLPGTILTAMADYRKDWGRRVLCPSRRIRVIPHGCKLPGPLGAVRLLSSWEFWIQSCSCPDSWLLTWQRWGCREEYTAAFPVLLCKYWIAATGLCMHLLQVMYPGRPKIPMPFYLKKQDTALVT